mmetsp:Transcript_45801/g.118484  ORF Transcript_45801/g.118484 Transcript_45801/m.118484 type:complete len:210 (-) Transcript_45801:318-947(-)
MEAEPRFAASTPTGPAQHPIGRFESDDGDSSSADRTRQSVALKDAIRLFKAPSADLTPDHEVLAETGEDRPAPGKWSRGAALHAFGVCRPCRYIRTIGGCKKDSDCSFCHQDHAHRDRSRPGKSTRRKCKKIAESLDTATIVAELDNTNQEILSGRSRYLESVLKSKVRTMQRGELTEKDSSVFAAGSSKDGSSASTTSPRAVGLARGI